MAVIKPFTGWIFNPSLVDIGQAVAPPYDVIDSQERKRLAGYPYNLVHLTLTAAEAATEGLSENPYDLAAARLSKWKREEILSSGREAIFCYKQHFSFKGKKHTRTSYIAAIRIEDGDETIVPHERTLPKALEDRHNLIKATKANLEPIFALFTAPELRDLSLVTHPLIELEALGEKHNIEALDPVAAAEIIRILKDKALLIADGHHRYRTSKSYRDEMRALYPARIDQPWDYVMMNLVETGDHGLIVLPTHRKADKLNVPIGEALSSLRPFFEITELPSSYNLAGQIEAPESKSHIGIFAGGTSYLLKLKDDSAYLKRFGNDKSDRWSLMEVNLLHQSILPAFGFDADSAAKGEITFSPDAEEIIEEIRQGDGEAAFLLPQLDIHEVEEIAASGEIMPQKTTYFYPKMPSGLVMRLMEY